MKQTASRRSVLQAGLAGAAALSLGTLGSALPGLARAAARPLSSQRLSDGLLLISGAGGNIVAARDARGLLLVDGGTASAGPDALQLALRELGARKAHTLINTHWHGEHTGLNELLGRQGARIIAHENTRLWLSTDVRLAPDAAPIKRLSAKARPNDTTYSTGSTALGDETVSYGYLSQAHTDGDLYVKFAKANVLVTGGVVAGQGWPTADWVTGGWISGTAAGYKTLIGLCDAQTRVVTANGTAIIGKAELEAEMAIIANLADQLTRMLRKGFAPADMLAAAPAKDYEAKLGDATQFLTESFKSLWPRMAPDA
jgi:glyoxylase-like metal-dependent hydrolase (beta-lactamase superfamily II)